MSKHLKKIQCKKRYFVKYFWISFILMFLVCLLMMFFKHGFYNWVAHFYDITYKEFSFQVLTLMNLWKILIIQFALAPMLAMICVEKYIRKHDTEYDDYERRMM